MNQVSLRQASRLLPANDRKELRPPTGPDARGISPGRASAEADPRFLAPSTAAAIRYCVRRASIAITAAAGLLAMPTLAADTRDASARFAVSAELRPQAASANGRFTVDAGARHVPQVGSADHRFALKAVHVPAGGCVALPDPLFSNGFE